MSMSVETIMYNYQVRIEKLKNICDFNCQNLQLLLQRIKDIDVSNQYIDQINDLINRLNDLSYQLENNDLLEQLSKINHVDLELAKTVNLFLDKKINQLADLQQKGQILRIKALETEQNLRLTSLIHNTSEQKEAFIAEIIENLTDNLSRTVALNYLETNKEQLVNLDNNQIIANIQTNINIHQDKTMINKLAQSFEMQISEDKYVEEMMRNKISEFTNAPDNLIAQKALELQSDIIKLQIDEATRKSTISSIIKAVAQRGFITDTNNIRIIDENGYKVVVMYSQKTTGEEAIFKVYLDGRFTYKFWGYEGHEHDVDVQPFVEALASTCIKLSTEQHKRYMNPDELKQEMDRDRNQQAQQANK